MLRWALIFLVIGLVAGLLGFTGIGAVVASGVQRSVASGFAHGFLAAGMAAAVAGAIVVGCMRTPTTR